MKISIYVQNIEKLFLLKIKYIFMQPTKNCKVILRNEPVTLR
jgi:hypothetical protein